VQRARSQEEVIYTIGEEVKKVGYHCVLLAASSDLRSLIVRYMSWDSRLLRVAERLTGLTWTGLEIQQTPGGFFAEMLVGGPPRFCESTAELAGSAYPALPKGILDRVTCLLGIKRAAYAPLTVGGRCEAVLGVFGNDLTEGDLAPVTAFANQAATALENLRLVEELTAGRQRMQELAREMVTVLEEERRHLARSLHDEAGQALTVLKISLELLAEDLYPQASDLHEAADLLDFQRRVRAAASLAGDTMDRIRRLAQDLRPPALDAVGLNNTLKGLSLDFGQRTRLAIDYQGQDAPGMPDAPKIALYRFLQEALTNVAKHAQARRVWVVLNHDAEMARLMVRDDGLGFDARSEPWNRDGKGGMGLLGMRERLSALGGWLEIDSQPGRGTSVTAYLPLEEWGAGQ
jgi:signal transduction histidine kinase